MDTNIFQNEKFSITDNAGGGDCFLHYEKAFKSIDINIPVNKPNDCYLITRLNSNLKIIKKCMMYSNGKENKLKKEAL